MDRQVEEIRADQTGIKEELEHSRQQETEIQHANEAFQKMLEEQKELENKAESELSGIQLEEANIRQKVEFAQTNVERINGDLENSRRKRPGFWRMRKIPKKMWKRNSTTLQKSKRRSLLLRIPMGNWNRNFVKV